MEGLFHECELEVLTGGGGGEADVHWGDSRWTISGVIGGRCPEHRGIRGPVEDRPRLSGHSKPLVPPGDVHLSNSHSFTHAPLGMFPLTHDS